MAEIPRRVQIYLPDGTTPITRRSKIKAQRRASDKGSASFELQIDDPQQLLIDTGDLLRWDLDGQAWFYQFVTDIEEKQADPNEDAGEVVVFTGTGSAGYLSRAIVYPPTGIHVPTSGPFTGRRIGRKPADPTRYEGFCSPHYTPGPEWVPASPRFQQCQNPPQAPPGGLWGAPKDWPDPSCWWIASQPVPATPPGDPTFTSYFRGQFTIGGSDDVTLAIYAAWDDQGDIYLNGVPLMGYHDMGNEGWAETHRVVVQVSPGVQTITSTCTNFYGMQQFICYVSQITPTWLGVDLELPIYRSGVGGTTDWIALHNPLTPPGFNSGELMLQYLTEAQDRGVIPGVTPTFSATVDSGGTEWGYPNGMFQHKVGLELPDVLEQLSDAWIEWDLAPSDGGLALGLWIAEGIDLPDYPGAGLPGPGLFDVHPAPGRGTDKSGTIRYNRHLNTTTLVHKIKG